MKKNYETPNAEVIELQIAENVMVEDELGNFSATEGLEDW